MTGFDSAADFRGERVRVVSNDGQVFQGWVAGFDPSHRHVVLLDATLVQEGTTARRGRTFVSHADSIEVLEPEGSIRRVDLAAVTTADWHAAEYHVEDHRLFVDEVRRDGWAGSYPVVRPIVANGDRYFEVVEGHKRLWAASEAGLYNHPARVVELDDWAAARRFVYDHLPAPRHVDQDERHENWYDDADTEAAIEALLDEFGERALTIDRVAFNAERLGPTVLEGGDAA